MAKYLPADLIDRITELRRRNGYTQKYVAENIGISESNYSRIENRDIVSVGHNLLIGLAKLYDVPADFLLGINDAPDKTYFEIKQLGLSVDSAISLYEQKPNREVINRFLVNDKFCKLTRMIAVYFSGCLSDMTEAGNIIRDINYDMLMNFTDKGLLPNDDDVRDVKRGLKASKEKKDQYDLIKINEQFMTVLKEMKKECKEEEPHEENVLDIEKVKEITRTASENMIKEGLSKQEKLKISVDAINDIVGSVTYFLPRDREKMGKALTTLIKIMEKYGRQIDSKESSAAG